jgi:hypothetical protein
MFKRFLNLYKSFRHLLVFFLPIFPFFLLSKKARTEKMCLKRIIRDVKRNCEDQSAFSRPKFNSSPFWFYVFVGPNGPREVVDAFSRSSTSVEISDDFIRSQLSRNRIDQKYAYLIVAMVEIWLVKHNNNSYNRGSYLDHQKMKITELIFCLWQVKHKIEIKKFRVLYNLTETIEIIRRSKVPIWYSDRVKESPEGMRRYVVDLLSRISGETYSVLEVMSRTDLPRAVWLTNMLMNANLYFHSSGELKEFPGCIDLEFPMPD